MRRKTNTLQSFVPSSSLKRGWDSLRSSAPLLRIVSFLDRIGWAKVATVLTSSLLVALILIRMYYSIVTGYLLPDESYYYSQYILNHAPLTSYRPFFHVVFLLFFQGTGSISQLFVRGAIFSSIWAVGTTLALYKILREIGTFDKHSSLVLLSLPLFPIFSVMAVFFVTETLGIFLAFLGILFSIRYLKRSKLVDVALAAIFFVLAYQTREPYLLLALGNFLVLLFLKPKLRGLAIYALIALIVVPVPISIYPVSFTQPVTNFLFVNLPSYLASLQHPVVQNSSVISTATIGHTSVISTATIGHTSTSVTSTSTLVQNTVAPTTITLSLNLNDLSGFFLGLVYGFGPLFAIFTVLSLAVVAGKKDPLSIAILLIMLLALGTFLIASDSEISLLPSGIGPWLSDIVRLADSAVLVLVGFGYFYAKFKPKYLLALLLVYLVIGLALVPQLGGVLQASQNPSGQAVNRLSLDYRAPYFRMYQIASTSGNVLIIGGLSLRGIRVYASMLPNVNLTAIPPTQQDFNSLLNHNWSAIFLYDDYYTIASPNLISAYPAYYQQVVLSHSYGNYVIKQLWVDGESYALQLVKEG